MKFTTNTKSLIQDITLLNTLPKSNANLSVLEGVIIQTNKKIGITLKATDLNSFIQIEHSHAIIRERGVCVVNRKRLLQTLKGFKGSMEVQISTNNNFLTVETETKAVSLQTIPVDDMPIFPSDRNEEDDLHLFDLENSFFTKELNKISYAVKRYDGEFNPVLQNIKLEATKENTLNMIATNGHILSLISLENCGSLTNLLHLGIDLLVPIKELSRLKRIIKKKGILEFSIDKESEHLIIKQKDKIVTIRLYEGIFPDCKAVIPPVSDLPYTLKIDRIELLNTLTDFPKVGKDDEPEAVFEITTDSLTIKTPDNGDDYEDGDDFTDKFQAAVPARYRGEHLTILFNPIYLSSILKPMESQEIAMFLQGPAHPCSIAGYNDPELTIILMPIKA